MVCCFDVGDVGEYEVFVCECLVDEVLDGCVQVAVVVWLGDFFCELSYE